ncbi:LamB/YcsF family protein [Photobacterium sanctipauli]|uniref:LamB/YcsF family protein n=1 Tax=Photobacterium sanctipauli TaxID=1342794 RepID=A0A2T3NNQ2_9GAMM|nr:5-oxoprolinase subunit PxpA [Photobacterium sanctipauli]PSW17611.1 LamB/YcsF family protein [Photobacterium sanctipauli]
MKLNCDMGESFGQWKMGNDAAVMPWVDMANIACGFHASDPDHMSETVMLAKAHQVDVGAHPGYDDKEGFGRRSIPHSHQAIANLVAYQVGALSAISQYHGVEVSYVKPHGALYNDMMADEGIFTAIVESVSKLNLNRKTPLKLMILARVDNTAYSALASKYQVELLFEAFADRAYDEQGLLVARSLPGSVYHDSTRIRQQVAEFSAGYVTTISGTKLKLRADSICVHGDNDESIAVVKTLHGDLHP